MKVILFVAMTANGIIARENGEEDFLSDRNWKKFCKLAKSAGCFVVGRGTYEVVKSLYKDYKAGYIISKSPEDAIKKARLKGHKRLLNVRRLPEGIIQLRYKMIRKEK